jgi:hypothetical protein
LPDRGLHDGEAGVKKVDLRKDYKAFYSPSVKTAQIVKIPAMKFLMVDGHGDPNKSPEYVEALQALYTTAYTLKFGLKKSDGIDFTVMPLQGLWWADDMNSFLAGRKDEWQWTMMIALPGIITARQVKQAVAQAIEKKDLAGLARVRFEKFTEGLVAQIMYLGPYSAEGPTIETLHEFIADNGYARSGKHHEIYMGDPRRTAPSKLKTIIRQPIRRETRS